MRRKCAGGGPTAGGPRRCGEAPHQLRDEEEAKTLRPKKKPLRPRVEEGSRLRMRDSSTSQKERPKGIGSGVNPFEVCTVYKNRQERGEGRSLPPVNEQEERLERIGVTSL